jgi:pyruvate formate lyase activating enzyme
VDTAKIRRSIEIIRSSGLRHEFRTTVVRTQLTPRDLTAVAGLIGKGDLYVLQPFIPGKTLKDAFASEVSYSPEEFSRIRAALSGKGQNVQVRLSA